MGRIWQDDSMRSSSWETAYTSSHRRSYFRKGINNALGKLHTEPISIHRSDGLRLYASWQPTPFSSFQEEWSNSSWTQNLHIWLKTPKICITKNRKSCVYLTNRTRYLLSYANLTCLTWNSIVGVQRRKRRRYERKLERVLSSCCGEIFALRWYRSLTSCVYPIYRLREETGLGVLFEMGMMWRIPLVLVASTEVERVRS